jgi:allantoinase
VWTEARRRGAPLERILPLFTTGPADLVRLPGRGRIAPESPAHLAVFDPDLEFTVDASTLEYRNKLSPWHGARLTGAVVETWLHGRPVYRRDEGVLGREGREVLA